MRNHHEVIASFLNKGRPTEGSNIYWGRRSYGADESADVLYSYGEHFPMAIRIPHSIKRLEGKDLIIINGDRYSNSTSKHQSKLQSSLRKWDVRVQSVTVSINAFSRAFPTGGLVRICTEIKLKDWTEEEHFYLENMPETLPIGTRVQKNKNGEIVYAHRPCYSLWETDGKYYLAGMDEGTYFLSILATKPRTVEQAFKQLKPQKVKVAEAKGLVCPRQGEWFFIPQIHGKEAKNIYKDWITACILPSGPDSNAHVATRGASINGLLFVSGSISHPEHRTLRLSTAKNPIIFEAVKNTAVQSFSASGVD